MTKAFLIICALTFAAIQDVTAQHSFFSNYQPLKVSGDLPGNFLESSAERYAKQAKTVAKAQTRASRKAEDRFYELNGYFSENARLSGKVLIDDTVTNYLTSITDQLLSDLPNLRERIS